MKTEEQFPSYLYTFLLFANLDALSTASKDEFLCPPSKLLLNGDVLELNCLSFIDIPFLVPVACVYCVRLFYRELNDQVTSE